jgi:hypothetical protein
VTSLSLAFRVNDCDSESDCQTQWPAAPAPPAGPGSPGIGALTVASELKFSSSRRRWTVTARDWQSGGPAQVAAGPGGLTDGVTPESQSPGLVTVGSPGPSRSSR